MTLCHMLAPNKLPRNAKDVWTVLLSRKVSKGSIESKKFPLIELESPVSRELRRKCKHRGLSSDLALDRCLPTVHYVSKLELLLKELAMPLWKEGILFSDPRHITGYCALTGQPTRFYGHPASAEIINYSASLVRKRCSDDDLRFIVIGVATDDTHQYGDKYKNAMITLFPTKRSVFRTLRSRETFMTMRPLKLPSEIAQLRKGYSAELRATLYQKAFYASFVEPFNAMVTNGMC